MVQPEDSGEYYCQILNSVNANCWDARISESYWHSELHQVTRYYRGLSCGTTN